MGFFTSVKTDTANEVVKLKADLASLEARIKTLEASIKTKVKKL